MRRQRIVNFRVGVSGWKSLLSSGVTLKAEPTIDTLTAVHLPMSERVLDKLADILFATDELLDMLGTSERAPDRTTIVVERSVRQVYEQVNELMQQLAD